MLSNELVHSYYVYKHTWSLELNGIVIGMFAYKID